MKSLATPLIFTVIAAALLLMSGCAAPRHIVRSVSVELGERPTVTFCFDHH